jgi:hypothetical protein
MTGVLTPAGHLWRAAALFGSNRGADSSGKGHPLGIKIVSVEPGGMRTDWGEIARGQVPAILPDYMASQRGLCSVISRCVGT